MLGMGAGPDEGAARMREQALEVWMDGSMIRVLFARRGEQLVVMEDDGRMGSIKTLVGAGEGSEGSVSEGCVRVA